MKIEQINQAFWDAIQSQFILVPIAYRYDALHPYFVITDEAFQAKDWLERAFNEEWDQGIEHFIGWNCWWTGHDFPSILEALYDQGYFLHSAQEEMPEFFALLGEDLGDGTDWVIPAYDGSGGGLAIRRRDDGSWFAAGYTGDGNSHFNVLPMEHSLTDEGYFDVELKAAAHRIQLSVIRALATAYRHHQEQQINEAG